MTRVEKLSETLYTVNGKRVMFDKSTIKPLDQDVKLSWTEQQVLLDFIKVNETSIKIKSTVR
jgi:hypothetical protein